MLTWNAGNPRQLLPHATELYQIVPRLETPDETKIVEGGYTKSLHLDAEYFCQETKAMVY